MTPTAAEQLATCGFPERWAGSKACVLLDTAFGQGLGVLAAWQAWRDAGAQAPMLHTAPGAPRPVQLVVVSIAARPPAAAQLLAWHAHTPRAALARHLAAVWPAATPDLHLLDLEPGVRMLLAVGLRPWLRQLRLQADLVLLDESHPPPGACTEPGATRWGTHALKALGRLLAPQAMLLGTRAGLPIQRPRRAPAAPSLGPARRCAVIVGAGIAGACCAAALTRAGWACTVLDANAAPAQGASGNPAGLFHGTVHAGDGMHARFTRACALHATRVMRGLIAAGVPGRADGFLRAHANAATSADWPSDWVQRLDAGALHERAPALRADSAWFYPGGGWIDAAAAVRHLLAAPGIVFQSDCAVHALQRDGDGWCVLDAQHRVLATAPTIVLATAGQLPTLLDAHGHAGPSPELPAAQHSRGQLTWFDSPASLPHPVAGQGYAVAWQPGRLLCGASSQPGDDDPAVRDSDHAFNLQRLALLTGIQPLPGSALHGRVGWRHQTADRLPLAGAVPSALQPLGGRFEQLRDVARVPGLWTVAGLGGRGFTWAPLLGEVVAAMVGGGPMPMDSNMLDAVDPARGLLRHARRTAAGPKPLRD